jgi:hypothetical protein
MPPRHRFDVRLFLAFLAFFAVFFSIETAVDIAIEARRAGVPLFEAWARCGRSALACGQAGATLARAAYSALSIFVAVFFLSIPFSANLYTPKVVTIFLSDRVNQAALALGILASANTHFQTTTSWAQFRPEIALVANTVLVATSWALILPYAIYAWRFLEPQVILGRLERRIERDLWRAAARPGEHAEIATRVEQTICDMGNVVIRAIERADRDLTLDGVRSLARAYAFYLGVKPRLPEAWFAPEREWFAGLSREAFHLVERERTWVGHLLLHQMWLAYAACLSKMPDAAGAISAAALRAVSDAPRIGDSSVVALGMRFANTFIREAIKRGDAVTVQTVLRLQRAMLRKIAPGAPERIAEAATHLRYYHDYARGLAAHEAADAVALALARLVEFALESGASPEAALEAFERLEDPAQANVRALLKARALVASCLAAAGRGAERLSARIAAVAAPEREAVRAALEAAPTRAAAGREAYGAEPGIEFVGEPRRSEMIALFAA